MILVSDNFTRVVQVRLIRDLKDAVTKMVTAGAV